MSDDGQMILDVRDLRVRAGEQADPRRARARGARGRSARDHGAERLGQEHARPACSRAARVTRSLPGSATYLGRDLLAMAPEERAREGLFLAFQYPVEIPGVNNVYLLKAALNAQRKHRGQPELDAFEFLNLVREKLAAMRMDE